MKSVICAIALLVVGAHAFVPPTGFQGALRSRGAARPATTMGAVDQLAGADVETGGVWDPLGLSQNEDALSLYRAAELKHGRVCMMAVLGVIVQTYFQLPDPVFNNPRPLEAIVQVWQQRPEAIIQILLAIGATELYFLRQSPEDPPGSLQNFGAAFRPRDEAKFEELQRKELKNGRLAMIGISGMLVQEALTGQGPLEQIQVGHISPFGDGQGYF
ncbi:unnamed protein product [Vitrella brassicaformis CCMP3155]|uniref:Uncharacterized protein n=2 Tax=Vitrella brassicaformis TaxID=1169539 RepID=A0A0G4FFG9_VITBC|nr:unnamed protein product [Vitrella brassicaformis CCMP3155]|mmetsp:Transcript_14628/g.34900  ORF Transcript_14628/g.34900 Transcript_14628/m.34900 type:complete len:216 (+) Transcript_14628:47-694(+)|eukprot:CEM11606.1 unnamed protein product [Vitrella brassicaformis CCMP3155]